MRLILYSKPGCHLCEGLQEKLEAISSLDIDLDIRDITTRPDWFNAYQYEIPVLLWVPQLPQGPDANPDAEEDPGAIALPRLSPRASVDQVEQWLRRHCCGNP